MRYFVIVVLSFLFSYFGTWYFRRFTIRKGILLDIPNERSSHRTATPRGAGVIFVLVFLVTSLFYFGSDIRVLYYTSGSLLIAIVSWLDDFKSIPVLLRLSIHFFVGIMVVYFLGYFEKLYVSESVGVFFNESLGWLVTLLWIVWLINAYNFMDGIDGIAAAQAIAASFGWCVVSFLLNWEITFFISLLLLSCVSGFVLHNFPNAKVFMGDVGSAFLGYSFAVIPLIDTDDKGKTFLLAIFFVFLFLFDTAYTLLRRLRNAEKIWRPHRSHLYQRLVIAGLSHCKVTAIYFILSGFNMLAGVLFFISDCLLMLLVPLSTAILIVSMVWYFENSSRYLTIENVKK